MTGSKTTPDTPRKPLVLVVDDEVGPRESITYALSADFSVEATDRAAAALELARAKEYAVIVLDIRMREMDGLAALTELRKFDKDVAVIMLTGFGTLQSAQESMLAGANQYLRKPPDVGELIEAVQKQALATRVRRQQTKIHREMRVLNQALKRELAAAEPQMWQARTSAELVHDLTSPLMVMLGYATLVMEEAQELALVDRDQAKRLVAHASMVARAADYARHLVDNWRQVTKDTLSFAAVDLTALAEEARSLLFFDHLAVRVCGDPKAFVRGARYELLRVLQNLVKNALEAGASAVEVKITRTGREVAMAITDNGGGMPPEDVEQALKGRYTTKATGSGLGLQICRHLVGVHGGRFKITSRPGTGTTILVTLPAAEEGEDIKAETGASRRR